MADAGEWVKMINDLRVELGGGMPAGFGPVPWSRPNAPPGWILANGAVLLANTPHTALRQAYIDDGFPYGQDGSGNPKIPDMRGVVPAGRDNMGGTAANRLAGATALGTIMGAQTHTLSAAEMPYHAHGVNDPTHAHSVYDPGHNHGLNDPGHRHSYTHSTVLDGTIGNGASHSLDQAANTGYASTGITLNAAATGIGIYGAGTGISIQAAGGGAAHNNVQPTVVCNYIVKV